jgi:ribose transport system ATP-binding protein
MSEIIEKKVPLLKTISIKKSFMDNVALGNISMCLYSGECLALVGENGAGKSTLMKILSGVYRKDEGEIYIKGKPIDITNPKLAQTLGISIIHQEFNLIPELTVAENIFLGREKTKGFIINDTDIYNETQKLLEYVNVSINPRSLIRELTIAEKQITEILKALSLNADIIIMDEPTASLNLNEVNKLFQIIHKLKSEGKGVIYISHRLEELKTISDRIAVLRDGVLVKELDKEADIDTIIEYMVGRKIENLYPEVNIDIGRTILEVHNLSGAGNLKNINLSVKEGEIVGISGLMGSGQTQLARCLYGMTEITEGDIIIRGKKSSKKISPKRSIENGVVLISEDRKDEGLILGMSIANNVTLSNLKLVSNRAQFINSQKEISTAEDYTNQLKIKSRNSLQEVMLLSGGNQQKVVFAKVLFSGPEVIIMCEPTRGVDVNAKVEIYKLINEFVKEKKAVILISSELPEVLGLSNRVLVMYNGEIVKELRGKEEMTQEKVMYYATGGE